MRDTFVFYRSFKESMDDLSDTDKLTMYEAISDYSLDLIEPELTGFPKALFKLVRPILDANIQRWRNGCKGGAPSESLKGNQNAKKRTKNEPDSNLKRTKNKANKDKDKNNIIGESNDSPTALAFENIWSLYGKKGNKKTSEKRWNKISVANQKKTFAYIPAYVKSTPDKQFRKNLETFLSQECWNDELPDNNQVNNQNHETERNYI